MSQFMTAAMFDQQMSTSEIRQAREVFQVITPRDRAAWSKFGINEEIADLLEWSALPGETYQAGNHVVEADQFRGTVRPYHAQKDFCRLLVNVHAEIERTVTANLHFLRDVVAAVGESQAGAHAATTIPWNGTPQR